MGRLTHSVAAYVNTSGRIPVIAVLVEMLVPKGPIAQDLHVGVLAESATTSASITGRTTTTAGLAGTCALRAHDARSVHVCDITQRHRSSIEHAKKADAESHAIGRARIANTNLLPAAVEIDLGVPPLTRLRREAKLATSKGGADAFHLAA